MPGAVAKLFVVVAAAILNQPSLFPQENVKMAEEDEDLMTRMREHAEQLERERIKLEAELPRPDEGGQWEEAYSWYFWGTVSFLVFFGVEMCRAETASSDVGAPEDDETLPSAAMVLDKDVLSYFCDKRIHVSSRDTARVREFVEGFADDLLESLRSLSDRRTFAEVGDFVGIGSVFESRQTRKPPTCDLLVTLSPPEPLDFRVGLWCDASSRAPPDRRGCGTVQVSAPGDACPCALVDSGEDVLCLLHGKNDVTPVGDLCEPSSLLGKDAVMKWFQESLTQAWGHISHKYDFQVTFRRLDAPGALKVRFPSGKAVMVNIIPAIQLADTDAYLVSHFPSARDGPPDPFWPLSLAVYERDLLKHLSKLLPPHPCHLNCLQVVTFLHRKQTTLTGANALSDYHWKTVLLHILLLHPASVWTADKTEARLRDILDFMHRSLREKRLCHALIGNGRVPPELKLPESILKAEPVNLFRDLVLKRDLHAATVRHVQEMSRNAAAILQEYSPLSSSGRLD
ncbi:inositol 1,4,5-trisphosphate receptor-interacting protein [Stigmatopora nigra]